MSAIVQLVQITQPFLQRNYLPYAAGLLQAYVLRHAAYAGRYTFLQPMIDRLPLAEAPAQLQLVDILALSTYVWNMKYSLALAQVAKQQKPAMLVIMGGPQVPDRAEDFLRQHPWVDVVTHGEGEAVFLELLEAWPGRDWSQIAGISYLDPEGKFVHQPRRPRLKELDQIPSPYLLGLFDSFLKQQPGDKWVAMWETNRGCPFSCSFCDWGAATASKVYRFGMERLKAEIDWFGKQNIHLVYCTDANYGIFERDLEITEYMVASRQRLGAPKSFYIQNTKNVTERAYKIQTLISQAGMIQAIALALQSVNPEVLKNIQRQNISLDTYRELQLRFRADGVDTYSDILMGLPGETLESFIAGLDQVIEEGQHHLVRFHNVYLLPNAEMAQPEYRRQHGIETVWNLYAEPFAPVENGIVEMQEMIKATASLPVAEWRKVRQVAWWAELLYFNHKLAQLPLVLIRRLTGLSYAQLFRWFLEGEWPATQILADIRQFMNHKALAMEQGESELCVATVKRPGAAPVQKTWMTVEHFLFSGLDQSNAWPQFFQELMGVLEAFLAHHRVKLPAGLLAEALELCLHLRIAQIADRPFELKVSSNFWQVYLAAIQEQELAWQAQPQALVRDWSGKPYDRLKVR